MQLLLCLHEPNSWHWSCHYVFIALGPPTYLYIAAAVTDRHTCFVQEVYLLKRHPDSMVVEDCWHAEGPFDGNTLSSPPVWAGTWLIDVLVCIHDCDDGRSFWLKAMHRNVPAASLNEQ